MEIHEIRRVALSTALLLILAAPSSAQLSYFGPMKVRIGSTASDPYPLYHSRVVFQSTDTLTIAGACMAVLDVVQCPPFNPACSNPGDPRVELPAQLVFSALIDSYGGSARWRPSEDPTCFLLLNAGTPGGHEGTCLLVDGHQSATPDLFGATWVADHVAAADCP